MLDLRLDYADVATALECDFKIATAKELTTFKGGGKACVFYPDCESKFIDLYNALMHLNVKPYILGGGSNTIMADGFLETPLISVKRLSRVKFENKKVLAECGAYISKVTDCFRDHDMGGFEFLSGVPATVGGVVRMNASAFSTETADYVDNIRVLTLDCDKYVAKTLCRDNIDFKYRHGVNGIVLGATFNANGLERATSLESAKAYTSQRRAKQPSFPSCGSVFKNGDIPSGKLIELCGLKGKRIGGAQISEMHGNFIVNIGGATADDFMALVQIAEQCVYKEHGIILAREFVYVT